MPENLPPEEFEAKVAAQVDAWITARLTGREHLALLSNLDSQTVNFTALAQDLLSLAEDIQPNHDFVLDLEAKLRRKVLTKYHTHLIELSASETQQTDANHGDS